MRRVVGVMLMSIGINILGCTTALLRNSAGTFRRVDGWKALNLRDEGQINKYATYYGKARDQISFLLVGRLW